MIVNQGRLTLSRLPPPLLLLQALGRSRPETAHFKAISDGAARCTSAEKP